VPVLFVMVLLAAVPPAQAGEYEELMRAGGAHHKAFDNVKALECYTGAHLLQPGDFAAHMLLVRALNDAGEDAKGKEAERLFEMAVQESVVLAARHPSRKESWFFVAASKGNLSLFRGGREKVRCVREIKESAEKALSIDPDYRCACVLLGVLHREVAILNPALRFFADKFFGGLPETSLQASEELLLKAIRLDPGSIYANYELALTYEAMGRNTDTLAACRKILELPIADHQDQRKIDSAKEKLRTAAIP
jgi:tetratricopeptide (TPR) repeat protein